MTDLFNVGHVAQLNEIQNARLRRGDKGIGPEVEVLILRLRDPREAQIARYEELGLFAFLGAKPGDVPKIPEGLLTHDERFPHLLLLPPQKDGLLTHLGGKLEIRLYLPEAKWRPFDDRHQDVRIWTWTRFQHGRRNRNTSVENCRKAFLQGELFLTVLQGVCGYSQ